jgi:hypothetical protein
MAKKQQDHVSVSGEKEGKGSGWLNTAKNAFDMSTEYVDGNYRKEWEESLAHFQSKHAPSSKYHLQSFKHRSKTFRPKTRSSIRNNEAAAVAAFFSNQDVVNCEPSNPTDPMQKLSAEINQELLQYRLTNSIPWFQILIGGVQDAQVVGSVCSYQNWVYRDKEVKYEDPIAGPDGQPLLDENNEPYVEVRTETEIIKDEPQIQLKPVENIRLHPAADWANPIDTSPFLIDMLPMTVQDVKLRQKSADAKTGEPKWKETTKKDFQGALISEDDPTRKQRDKRENPYEKKVSDVSDLDMVWVHRNFIRKGDTDYVYYTLGTEALLSDPTPKEEVYPHLSADERPYTMGCCVLETHKLYPDGVAGLGKSVQREMNEIANQRLDNVKLVMNKRHIVKRNKNIDVKSLLRNVPGGVTFADDPVADIRTEDYQDVTSSSYAEQDRLNVDYDEVTGTFSTGSIQSNRKLGETVGGMSMLRGSSNLSTEYLLRVVAETWIEKTLKQLVKLEQYYENDATILNFAAEKSQLYQRYGMNQITDEMLQQDLTVTVNVGMGATDPVQRLEKFLMAMGQYMQIAGMAQQLGPMAPDLTEVRKEIFGRLGYKDGDRFFAGDEMQAVHAQYEQAIQQLQMQNQQLNQALQSKEQSEQRQSQIEMMKMENAKQIEQYKMAQGIVAQGAEDERQLGNNLVDLQLKRMDLMNPVAGERR